MLCDGFKRISVERLQVKKKPNDSPTEYVSKKQKIQELEKKKTRIARFEAPLWCDQLGWH